MRLMESQSSLKWLNGSTQVTMMQEVKEALADMLKSLGLVFVEEVWMQILKP